MPMACNPPIFGTSPPPRGLMRSQINVQELVVEALMTENRDHIFHAAALDPHTAAELDLDQIKEMTETMIARHGDWLPKWCQG